MQVRDVESDAAKSNAKRIGESGRKRKEDDAPPSNKLKKLTHGAGTFFVYQELCVEEPTGASILVRVQGFSFLCAGRATQAALIEKCIFLHESTCHAIVKIAFDNGCVGQEPQRNGGQALPSKIDKDITKTVKLLMEMHFPVFPDDLMKWAAEAIKGTPYAS